MNSMTPVSSIPCSPPWLLTEDLFLSKQTLRAGLVQMTSGGDLAANLATAEALIREAHAAGAEFILTPEVTPLLVHERSVLLANVRSEADDLGLAHFRALAAELHVWLLVGSIALKGPGDKLVNRSFLLGPDGAIAARYDKIHMFDVELGDGRVYRESATYAGGERAVIAAMPFGKVGLSVCYDLRFPGLYRRYAQAGAAILTVPSAFTKWTGAAHWHVLLRARAIETGAFVLAPAQVGDHGGGRLTYGHSLIVDPWGEVLADGGDQPGIVVADLDLAAVAAARSKIPAYNSDIAFEFSDNDGL